MTYSPNLPINSGWKSTIQNAFQVLRRIKFIVEDDFTFTDFDPQTDFSGMTVTNYLVNRARGIKIGSIFYFSINISATVAAPLASIIRVTLPYTAFSSGDQFGASQNLNAGTSEVGFYIIANGLNGLSFARPGYANFGAGATQVAANGFIEVN